VISLRMSASQRSEGESGDAVEAAKDAALASQL